MGGHVSRAMAATAVVAATGAGTMLFGASTAVAAPLIGNCDSSVTGKAGQPVSASTAGLPGTRGSIIPLGSVPRSGSTTLSVPTKSLLSNDSLLGLGGVLNQVTGMIGPTCDVTATALAPVTSTVNRLSAPVDKATGGALKPATDGVNNTISGVLGGDLGLAPPAEGGGGGAQPPQSPGAPGSPGGPGGADNRGPGDRAGGGAGGPIGRLPFDQVPAFGSLGSNFTSVLSPSALYGNLPFVTSGMFQPTGAGFGNQLPGFSPQFGMLGQSGQGTQVQRAGEAEALDAAPSGSSKDVGLPVLVAVLALSGVTGTLVRSWVLRRAS